MRNPARQWKWILTICGSLIVASTLPILSQTARAEGDAKAEPRPGRPALLARLGLTPGLWKGMSPEARRERVRSIPTEERRAMIQAAREFKRQAPRRARNDAKVGLKRITEPRKVAPKLAGMIQYDSGAVTGFLATGNFKGNLFNTVNNTTVVKSSGTITQFQYVALSTTLPLATATTSTLTSPVIAVWGPTSAGAAPLVFSTFGPASTGTFTAPGSVNYTGPNFIIGIDDTSGFTLFSTFFRSIVPAVDTGSTASQGFHGVSLNNDSTGLNPIVPLSSTNVVIRASGEVIAPVELMGFTVE